MQSKWTGGLETAILGGAAKITEKGDFVFLSPLVGIYAEERSRMGVEIASQSSGWGRSFPADSACHRSSCVQQNTVSFSTGVSRTTYEKPSGTRLRCKPAQSSTRIRRGDRELGFVAPRSAWPGRMGPVEYYTRRSHARCREIAVRRWRRFPPSFESDQDEVWERSTETQVIWTVRCFCGNLLINIRRCVSVFQWQLANGELQGRIAESRLR